MALQATGHRFDPDHVHNFARVVSAAITVELRRPRSGRSCEQRKPRNLCSCPCSSKVEHALGKGEARVRFPVGAHVLVAQLD